MWMHGIATAIKRDSVPAALIYLTNAADSGVLPGSSSLSVGCITIGLLLSAWFLFAGVSVALRLFNRSRARKIAQMTPEEIEEENTNDVRVGNKKLTFVYGT